MIVRQYKLRMIGGSGSNIKYGITIPSPVLTMFGQNTKFFIEISGTAILLQSGASIIPTDKQVAELNFATMQ